MSHQTALRLVFVIGLSLAGQAVSSAEPEYVEISSTELADKIGGGMLGQILGNLNGLPYEGKYIDAPGRVPAYVPALPEGACTDDDTDIEWVYIVEMQRTGQLLIPPQRIVELWRKHIRQGIWCSNAYAAALIELGFVPPATGYLGINPWAQFNIAGQFCCEAFGLASPAMPRAASQIALHYVHTVIDGEPAQATQFFSSLIARAFIEKDIRRLITESKNAVDPASEIEHVITDVLRWSEDQPTQWEATRDKLRQKYTRYGGGIRDGNGCMLNTGAVVGALIYGKGDFVETLRLAFSFGWDADCNAATAGTVVGAMKGRQWLLAQNWVILDRYRNRTRPGLPDDETISRYSERIAQVARHVILANGGSETGSGDELIFRIAVQKPAVVERLVTLPQRVSELRDKLLPQAAQDFKGSEAERARAVYVALALGEAEAFSRRYPEQWREGLKLLSEHPALVDKILQAPPGSPLPAWASAVGLSSRPHP